MRFIKRRTGDIWKDIGENNAQNKIMRHIQQRSANKMDRYAYALILFCQSDNEFRGEQKA